MRPALSLALLALLPGVGFTQTKEIQDAIERKLGTLRYVQSLRQPDGGFEVIKGSGFSSLSGTSAAVRTIKYLGGELADREKAAAFVMSCYDPESGGFGDRPRDGRTRVFLTAVGVMAAAELGVPKDKYAKALDYLKANAKTFEDVRIGAAAVEAWGVKDCPFPLAPWFEIADATANQALGGATEPKDGGSREAASVAAMVVRLGRALPDAAGVAKRITDGQRADGGWGKKGESASDLETTYRVMRALHLLKTKPADVARVRGFVALCRSPDGGYGVTAGGPPNVGGTYYAAVISKWLDEADAK